MTIWPSFTACATMIPSMRGLTATVAIGSTQPTESFVIGTSLVVTTADRVGALSELLTELALRGINLTRIESRPTKGRLGEYRFYIDLLGHVAEPRVGDALAALHRHCGER